MKTLEGLWGTHGETVSRVSLPFQVFDTSSNTKNVTVLNPGFLSFDFVECRKQLLLHTALTRTVDLLVAVKMDNPRRFLVSFSVAVLLGLLSSVFVLVCVLYYSGGLSWDGTARWNWHPVLSIIGYIFLQGIGE